MYDFNALKAANKTAKINQEKQEEQFEKLLEEADQLLMAFEEDQSIETLQKAAEKFSECLEYKSSNPEPYFSLAVIFSIIGKIELAMEYFFIVKEMAPDFPGLTEMMNYVIENSKGMTENEQHS